jgi:hypothetical protein
MLEDYEELRRRYPTGHPRTYMRLAGHWSVIGRRHELRGEWNAAERAYATAVSHDAHLAAVFLPNQPPDIRGGSLLARGDLGWLLARRGRVEEGAEYLRRCSDDLDEYRRLYPTSVETRRYLADVSSKWYRVARLLGRDRDAAMAASRVTAHFADLHPSIRADDRATIWATLPAAARDRKTGEALLTDPNLKSSRALVLLRLDRFADAEAAADDTTAGLFIRSVCRAKRGDAAGAKADHDAASAKLHAVPLRDPELVLLRREAETAGR